MFRTKLFFWLISLMTVLLGSCTQEEPTVKDIGKQGRLPETITTFKPSELAQIISDAEIPMDIWKEIHRTIQDRVTEGDDEFINLSVAIADTTNSRSRQGSLKNTRTKAGSCPKLREYLSQYIASVLQRQNIGGYSTTSNNMDLERFLQLLESSNLEIYWPYSEDWQQTPVINICYWDAPSELQKEVGTNPLLAMEYPVANVNLDTEVSENAFTSGNTIVIRHNTESWYTANIHLLRPVTVDQGSSETSGDYQTWGSDYDSPTYDPWLKTGENPEDYIYVWKLTKMMVSHQFDHKGAGGSEFEFTIVHPNPEGTEAIYNKYQVKFTRKEIDNHRIKTYDYKFNTNWTPEQTENGLILMEKDWCSSDNPLEFSIGFKGLSLSISIPLGNFDDNVFQCHYHRDYIITYRKERQLLYGDVNPSDNGNVYVKIPLIKVRKGTL